MKRSPQDWTLAPSEPEPKLPPPVTRTRLLEQVIIRRAILAEDKSLADPLGQWRRVR